jgi:hypothetical protein
VSLDFTATTHADHVRIDVTGTYSAESFVPLLERAFQRAADDGVDALLMDVRRVTGQPPTLAERYDLANKVSELQAARQPRIRFAMLGHEPMIHAERFGEIVATNRGAVVKAFTEEPLALAWLLGAGQRAPALTPPDALD